MELIERASFLNLLHAIFETTTTEDGHCVFISGEAGIGKTSLLKAFCKQVAGKGTIYQGACDALFTPRPLAPLYDILWQVNSDLWPATQTVEQRSNLFTQFYQELMSRREITLVIFEDVHWADEATLDFIKFFTRRITHLHCLFILTYRDEEIVSSHPLRNVLGQLPPDSFTRMPLTLLSRQAVEKMATAKGYNGEEVYKISGGNPFYVNEILESYSTGVPDNIKDSVLSVYNRQPERTKQVMEFLSVIPTGLEIVYLTKIESLHVAAIEQCLDSKILLLKDGCVFFKHELYRRTIESILSPLKRLSLNKKILDLLKESFEENQELERIIHHAKHANAYELVVQFAPLAARQAASVGAHIEASKLYLSAIEYYQGKDKDLLLQLYEAYAYECYLINRTKEAIIYVGKSLKIWQEKKDTEQIGNCLRFLSRLWWFDGNRKQAEYFGQQAIELLDNQPSSRVKAMAYSNMSQLKMLSGETDACLLWGEKAIAIAQELHDEEILSHALNNVGTVQMKLPLSMQKGKELLQQSLSIALKNSYHEHVARAYTNLGSAGVVTKAYKIATKFLEEGINYCEERDLDSWTTYMLSWKARMLLETGLWPQALEIADNLLRNENQPPVVTISALAVVATIKMRRGDPDVLPVLEKAKTKAFEAMELQRIIPSMVALLEYEWITGKQFIETEDLKCIISMIEQSDNFYETNELAFWLQKARKQNVSLGEIYEGYQLESTAAALRAAQLWEQVGCPYQQALTLFEASGDEKRKAIDIVLKLGAHAVYQKMKQQMRTSGLKSIPRGMLKSTQSNPAFLTPREIDVLQLLKAGMQNKEIADTLFISAKTVDHHISAILSKLQVNSRAKAVGEALRLEIIK
jgi:DNA-binding CsgD family transcriptional regulator/tetratricopeptide (TPR) repeat protein